MIRSTTDVSSRICSSGSSPWRDPEPQCPCSLFQLFKPKRSGVRGRTILKCLPGVWSSSPWRTANQGKTTHSLWAETKTEEKMADRPIAVRFLIRAINIQFIPHETYISGDWIAQKIDFDFGRLSFLSCQFGSSWGRYWWMVSNI